MIADGTLAMADQVINELTTVAHPDVVGAWAGGMRSTLSARFVDPPMALVGVVADQTPSLIGCDTDAHSEPADSYVIALALALIEDYVPIIVTSDIVDRLPV